MFGILITSADRESIAAALEMMAAESYRLVTPAIYEINLKTRYSEDLEMSQMFDLIREGIVFNFGLVYGFPLLELNCFWKNQLVKPTNIYASQWAANESAFINAIEDFCAKVNELDQ